MRYICTLCRVEHICLATGHLRPVLILITHSELLQCFFLREWRLQSRYTVHSSTSRYKGEIYILVHDSFHTTSVAQRDDLLKRRLEDTTGLPEIRNRKTKDWATSRNSLKTGYELGWDAAIVYVVPAPLTPPVVS